MSAAVCPRCGFANAPENRFCANCGNPMSATIGAATPPAPFAGPPPASWTGVPPPRSSTSGATIAIILVVVLVAALVAAVALIIGLTPAGPPVPTGNGPRAIGIAPARSADGTNWTLTFTSVPSGLTTSIVRLTLITGGGSTALPSTPLNALVYSTARAAYVQAVAGPTVGVGDRLLISTTTYPTGYQYQLSDGTSILASGRLA